MSIKYETTKIKPFVDPLSNEVHSWLFGTTGSCSETGTSAYFDAVWDVSDKPLLRYMFWTKQAVDLECALCNNKNNVEESIASKIQAINDKRVEVAEFDYNALPT